MSESGNQVQLQTASVNYVDASALDRPQNMPKKFFVMLAILVAIAIAVGAIAVKNVLDATIYASVRAQEEVNLVLNRKVDLDLPVLPDLMTRSDVEIMQIMLDKGYNTFDLNAASGSDEEVFDWVKLPSDVDLTAGSSYYVKGIGTLSSSEAATALYGSWRLTIERDDYTSMRVRYADFSAKTADEAIQNAFRSQHLESSEMGESGIDEVGNNFTSGTLTIDDGVYGWRISTCQLNEVYRNAGLPSEAYFVSVRVTG